MSSSSSSGSDSESDQTMLPLTPTDENPPLLSSKSASNPTLKETSLQSPKWKEPHTFHTLQTQQRFQSPSNNKFDHPELHELVAPHIESFNALFSSDPSVNPDNHNSHLSNDGLLTDAINNIPERDVYDGVRTNSSGRAINAASGSRLVMKVSSFTLSQPVSDTGKALYPNEVSRKSLD